MSSMSSVARKPLAFAIAMAFASSGAQAAAITVTDGGDAGTGSTCTLRQAIDSANGDSQQGNCTAGSGTDTIDFDASLANATITLQQGQLVINSSVTVNGSGQTIDAKYSSRVMAVYGYSGTTTNVTLASLTLINGDAGTYSGGGICAKYNLPCNAGPDQPTAKQGGGSPNAPQSVLHLNLALNGVTVSNNSSSLFGGGIVAFGAGLVLNQSTVSDNTNSGGGTIDNYKGGGIYLNNSYLTMTASTVSGNYADIGGGYATGGIYAFESGEKITNSTITGNSAACANDCAGALSVSGGGGFSLLIDSTVSGNSESTVQVPAAPSAVTDGIPSVGGALIGAFSAGTLQMQNTILSANSGDLNDLAVIGVATATASLLGSALSSSYTGNGNLFSDNPVLGPLQNNGGPTQTMALLTGSPAIDAGDNSLVPGLNYDQRGAGYSRIINGTVDIGAYEVQAAAPAPKPVPTISSWAMTLLGGLLALLGIARERRRRSG